AHLARASALKSPGAAASDAAYRRPALETQRRGNQGKSPSEERRAARRRETCVEPAMTRLNLLLVAVLTACALGLVNSQHRARRLLAGPEQRGSASQRRMPLQPGYRNSGKPRPYPRPQRRSRRHQHPSEIDLGGPGRSASERAAARAFGGMARDGAEGD